MPLLSGEAQLHSPTAPSHKPARVPRPKTGCFIMGWPYSQTAPTALLLTDIVSSATHLPLPNSSETPVKGGYWQWSGTLMMSGIAGRGDSTGRRLCESISGGRQAPHPFSLSLSSFPLHLLILPLSLHHGTRPSLPKPVPRIWAPPHFPSLTSPSTLMSPLTPSLSLHR